MATCVSLTFRKCTGQFLMTQPSLPVLGEHLWLVYLCFTTCRGPLPTRLCISVHCSLRGFCISFRPAPLLFHLLTLSKEQGMGAETAEQLFSLWWGRRSSKSRGAWPATCPGNLGDSAHTVTDIVLTRWGEAGRAGRCHTGPCICWNVVPCCGKDGGSCKRLGHLDDSSQQPWVP